MADELPPLRITPSPTPNDNSLTLKSCDFAWDAASEPTLRSLSLRIPHGQLVAVIGPVGAGKSSLLSALAGEMRLVGGVVSRPEGWAVRSAMTPVWIRGGTIGENVVLGKTVEEVRLTRCLNAVGMEKDLKDMADGVQTVVGEGGVRLSGGQRVRVGLARCLYQDGELVLMDDPFASVDAHVARHIMEKAILGELKGRTRVVVTHSIGMLGHFDRVIVMREGRIVANGTLDEVMAVGEASEFVATLRKKEEENAAIPRGVDGVDKAEKTAISGGGSLIVPEERTVVSWETFTEYVRLAGGLTKWGSKDLPESVSGLTGILVYGALGLAQVFSITVQGAMIANGGCDASNFLHLKSLAGLLTAPMKFFETNPVGRIVSRFSKDIDDIDNFLPEAVRIAIFTMSLVLANLLSIAFVYPTFFYVLLPCLWIYYDIQLYYRMTAKQIKRLEAQTRAPVTAHAVEVLSGLAAIRSHGIQAQVLEEFRRKLDSHNRCGYLFYHMQRWLSVRLEAVSAGLIFTTAMLCVGFAATASWHPDRRTAPGPWVSGLALSYSLQITASLAWLIRQVSETERMLSGVERLRHYGYRLGHEDGDGRRAADRTTESGRGDGDRLSAWPAAGKVELDGVGIVYDNGSVGLSGVNLKIEAGSKVGVVGRTGAGKSTLVACLTRLVACSEGTVMIDGVNIADIGVRTLRRGVAVVPQDAVLFSGTIRWNLDPWNHSTDAMIWDALKRTGLEPTVRALPSGLLSVIKDSGSNWSAGQRQLLCLTRALLAKAKVLILDEATSSTDPASERLVRETLKLVADADAKMTIIVVTHRVAGLVGLCERVVVMDGGRIVEDGETKKLVNAEGGLFRALLEESRGGRVGRE
ncbi:hypothetical protein HK101_003168 [Irineochytrium annulatum]|nr:hypothetical protein HK101_003168 [Irineochytrium annulatum]